MWEGLQEEIRGNCSWMRKEHLEKDWKVLRHQWVEMVGSFLSERKRCHFFFPVENAVLITVYQIITLWEFSILPDSYFKFVLERNCHAAGSWHFCQALIIHVFYLEAKSVRSFQSGSYSWADGERWAWCLLPAICLEASHHGNSLPLGKSQADKSLSRQ